MLVSDSVQCAVLELSQNNAERTNLSSGFQSPPESRRPEIPYYVDKFEAARNCWLTKQWQGHRFTVLRDHFVHCLKFSVDETKDYGIEKRDPRSHSYFEAKLTRSLVSLYFPVQSTLQ